MRNTKKLRILAIETSGSTFSIALSENGVLISEVFKNVGLKHSEKLVPTLKKLLEKKKWKIDSIDKIAVTRGPGSFTGIRVGLSCAKTISQSMNIPLVAVNTLDLLRFSAPKGNYTVFPVIDALRNEVYIKKDDDTVIVGIDALLDDLSLKTGRSEKSDKKICFVGNAVFSYKERISEALGEKAVFVSEVQNYPRADILSKMTFEMKGQSYNKAEPLYIRRSWAEEKPGLRPKPR
ncbi:tRNA (adenosine(37)-N6)-threonylcarbamoyltransferase complex dimerization subunit type 1 TsaB [Elusimicrobiota bacterium]